MSVDYDKWSKKVSIECFKCGNLFNNDMHNCCVSDLCFKNPNGKYNPMVSLTLIGFKQTGKAILNINRDIQQGQLNILKVLILVSYLWQSILERKAYIMLFPY